jgi:antitoxin component YwqK of YwqJK toxin-antitoxin module
MRTSFLFLLLFILSLPTFAQKIETFYDYRWKETKPELARFFAVIEKTDSGWHRSDYFIQERKLQMHGLFEDSACKKANGEFHYYHSNGRLEKLGHYIHGKRDGLWLSYHYNGIMNDSITYNKGHRIGACYQWYENGYPSDSSFWNPDGSGIAIGWFNNGNPSYAGRYSAGEKKNGKWTYFHRNGKPSASEMYSDGVLVDKQYYDEQGTATDTVNKDRTASFPGGQQAWQNYLNKKLYFPTQYKIVNGDKAIVIVDAVIDEEGNVTDVTVSTPFHPAFDKIALQVVRKSPKWEPAIQHNRKLRYKIRQGIYFAQQKAE